MALKFAEHCDNSITNRGWSQTTYANWSSTAGRTGGGAFKNDTTDGTTTGHYKTLSLGNGLIRCALWFKATQAPTADSWIIRWSNAAGSQYGGVGVAATTGFVKVYPWNTSAVASATGAINVADGGWHFIESECYFADAGGSLKVWVDGTLDINVTGADTLTTGTVALDVLRIVSPVANSYADDILVWDDSGSGITGNLGGKALIMKTLRPTSDASVQFTRSTGANNYGCVDEAGAMSTTDYVEDGTSGHLDRYGFGDTGLTTETVKGVIVEAGASNPGAGSISLKLLSELSATTDESGAMALIGSVGIFQNIFATKPGGGAWSMSDADAATFGIKVA